MTIHTKILMIGASQVVLVEKNAPAKAGDIRDARSVSWWGRSLEDHGGGRCWRMMATYSSILAWIIPWAEEPGGLQSVRSQRHD